MSLSSKENVSCAYNAAMKETLCRLAGEGNFNMYRHSTVQKRLFVFSKCLFTSLTYCLGSNKYIPEHNVCFVKGLNQLRHHNNFKRILEKHFSNVVLYVQPTCRITLHPFIENNWPRIKLKDLFAQFLWLMIYVASGKRRFLNLYFLFFQASSESSIKKYCVSIKNFVCYNDQPFDVSAIVLALRRHTAAKTIVVQHGLILSPDFYFPVNADEFWGWGELSREKFTVREKATMFVVKGRFAGDKIRKSPIIDYGGDKKLIKALIAPSYNIREIHEIVKMAVICSRKSKVAIELSLKLHPATKFKCLLKILCKINSIYIESAALDMVDLAQKYDVLVTRCSTSAIDFLLLGKTVFVDKYDDNRSFPSNSYTYPLESIDVLAKGINSNEIRSINNARLTFLMQAINV